MGSLLSYSLYLHDALQCVSVQLHSAGFTFGVEYFHTVIATVIVQHVKIISTTVSVYIDDCYTDACIVVHCTGFKECVCVCVCVCAHEN